MDKVRSKAPVRIRSQNDTGNPEIARQKSPWDSGGLDSHLRV